MSQLAMMFKDAEKGVIGKRPERWITVLEAKPDDDLTEVRFKIAYVTEEKRKNLAEIVTGKKDFLGNYDASAKLREAFLQAAIQEIDGVNKKNFVRLGEFFLLNPGIGDQLEEMGRFPFTLPEDESDRVAFFRQLRMSIQLEVLYATLNLDAWASAAKADLGNGSGQLSSTT